LKIGDLVLGKKDLWNKNVPIGIIVGKSPLTTEGTRWWFILDDLGNIVEDAEGLWEVLQRENQRSRCYD